MTPDVVSLVCEGGEIKDWERYQIESDLLTPADAFHLVTRCRPGWTASLRKGATVQLTVNGTLAMVGILEGTSVISDRQKTELVIEGRDFAGGRMVDQAAPFLALDQVPLQTLVSRCAREAGVTAEFIAGAGQVAKDFKVNPGESCWDVCWRSCAKLGVGLWGDERGILMCGQPNYEGPPRMRFEHHDAGAAAQRNNAERISVHQSIAERFSLVEVYGQRQGSSVDFGESAAGAILASGTDPDVPYKKVLRIVDSDAKDQGTAQLRANTEVGIRKMKATLIEIQAPLHTQNQLVYKTNDLAQVIDDPSETNGMYYITKRRFTYSRSEGQQTYLVLTIPGVWGTFAMVA